MVRALLTQTRVPRPANVSFKLRTAFVERVEEAEEVERVDLAASVAIGAGVALDEFVKEAKEVKCVDYAVFITIRRARRSAAAGITEHAKGNRI